MRHRMTAVALLLPTTILVGAGTLGTGCATSVEPGTGGGDASGGSTPSTGGGTATGTGDGGTGGTDTGLCDVDCSTINTPDCSVAVCNDGMHPGTVGECVVVAADDGTTCDDGMFCTVNDACVAGVCEGGGDNDCGMDPPACQVVTCDETADSCSTMPGDNGDPCSDPSNLCLVNMVCQNGLCQGGQLNDCFFAPVPDPAECHESVCNPTTGMCEPQTGNDGASCTDVTDLCTDGKTCSAGACVGGMPKDCTALDVGCVQGVCNTTTGQCEPQPIMPGQMCPEAADQCNVGICDMNGVCQPQPANENGACDDFNSCTSGETCTGGSCTGGTAITACVNNDSCCPAGCNENNDSDCSCNINLAMSATADSSGGGQNSTGYGPNNWNDGVSGADCQNTLACNQCQGWINGSSNPNGGWMRYTWPAPVQVGSIWVDTSQCQGSDCDTSRSVGTVTVQWWNGSSWITAGQVTGEQGDFGFTFNPKVTTDQIRLFDVATACGSNPLTYEWYVWSGSACMPPP